MTREDFKQGVRFRVSGGYNWYKVHKSAMGHLFITRKGGANQGEVMHITSDGFLLAVISLEHVATAFVLFSTLELIKEE